MKYYIDNNYVCTEWPVQAVATVIVLCIVIAILNFLLAPSMAYVLDQLLISVCGV